MDPREKVELLEYEWDPRTGIATLSYSGGFVGQRDEPTHPSHHGWRADDADVGAKWATRPTRSITVGDRIERPDGTAYYV